MSIPTRTNSVDQQLNTQSNANQSFEGSASLHAPVFQLSTAGNGDGQDSDDPLKVSSGQLTFDAEGNDDPDSIYFTRVIHYPPVGNSGVTLGRGYDFGQRSVEQIRGHLTSAGIEESKISILVGAAGLTGDAAAEFVRANKTRVGEITHDQQKILFDIVYAELKADAIRISSKDDVVAKYGATDFENLHPAIMELMVDLRYRGDYKPSTRLWIQEHIANNDLQALATIMADTKWMDTYGVPEDRFRRRKEFMQNAVNGVQSTPLNQGNENIEALPADNSVSGSPVSTGTVTARTLNIRSSNSIGSQKVGQLTAGASVEIYETKDGWLRIGSGQWVHGDYVQVTASTQTDTQTESDQSETQATDQQTAENQQVTVAGETWDGPTNTRIAGLHPNIQNSARAFINQVQTDLSIKLRVTSGLRTYTEQDALYAQGRTTTGNKVTNARGGYSYHNFGLALDVVEIKDGKANWNTKWEEIANIGKAIGFEWGGDFKSIVDKPHFQMSFGLSTADLRNLYTANGGNYVPIQGAAPVNTETPETNPDGQNTNAIGTGTVNAQSGLNVRTGPNTSFNKVRKLSSGTSITIYDQRGIWVRIGDGEWVHSGFVSLNTQQAPTQDASTPSAEVTATQTPSGNIISELENDLGTAPESGNPVVDGSSWVVVDSNAILRDENGAIVKNGEANQTIPTGTKVSIVEDKQANNTTLVKVAELDSGAIIGWTNYSNLSVGFVSPDFYLTQDPNSRASYKADHAGWTNCRYVASEMVVKYLAETDPEMQKELGLDGNGVASLNVGTGGFLRILYEDKSHIQETTEQRNFKNPEWLLPHAQADEAFAYIDEYLSKGVPLVVGVDHTYNRTLSGNKGSSRSGRGYNEGTTDHFITLTGTGTDVNTGKKFYTFFDPGRSRKEDGASGGNKLIEDSPGKFIAEDVGGGNAQTYHLSMVVLFPSDRDRFSDTMAQNKRDYDAKI